MVGNRVFEHWGPIIIVSERILVGRAVENEDFQISLIQSLLAQNPWNPCPQGLRSASGPEERLWSWFFQKTWNLIIYFLLPLTITFYRTFSTFSNTTTAIEWNRLAHSDFIFRLVKYVFSGNPLIFWCIFDEGHVFKAKSRTPKTKSSMPRLFHSIGIFVFGNVEKVR